MTTLDRIYLLLSGLILAIAAVLVFLLAMRIVINFADINPFRRWVLAIKRWTDPMVEPVRRLLMQFKISYKVAPFICLLLTLLLGYVAIEFIGSVLLTIGNILLAIETDRMVAALGHLLFGLLAFYGMLLIVRIIFSWGGVHRAGRWLQWLNSITDPTLLPLRRRIPPVGMFDLSPLVAFLIIWVLQRVIENTMLR